MNNRSYKLEALVLSSFVYRDSDRIVNLFSRERGRQSALAKGALKPKNSLRGLCQPPRYCRLEMAKSRGSLDILAQGELVEAYLDIHNDLLKIAYSGYIAELILAGMPEQKPQEEVFFLALAAFTLLEMGQNPSLALNLFQLRFLKALGFTPKLDQCSVCGRRVEGSSFYLSPRRGGLVCASCYGATEGLICAGTVKTMALLLKIDLPRLAGFKTSELIQTEMGHALDEYLEYHLDYHAKAKIFLRQLLGEIE